MYEYLKSDKKFLVITCELYHAPCIDKFYQVSELLDEEHKLKHDEKLEDKIYHKHGDSAANENDNTFKETTVQVYWLDSQFNNVMHK